MTTRGRIWLGIIACALAVNLIIGVRGYSREAEVTGEEQAFEKLAVMMHVLQLIRKDYVDADRVDYRRLIYAAVQGMVNSLDPFSDFMTPEDYSSMMESTEGEFGGLGIIVTIREGVLTVVTPIEGTPGFKVGLLPGDRIIEIEGESTENMNMPDAVKLLKGEVGTSVTITIFRPGTEERKEFTIERALIPVTSIKDVRVIEGTKVGYIRITQFNDPTAANLGEALKDLQGQGIESLVLDLRNNPGGLLESAVDVCSYFLEEDKLVVSTEGRRPSQKRAFKARGSEKYTEIPIAILINRGSASAAEIVAGCLQDWGRAILVGGKSFGKGSVQNVIELPDGSALRLTTAMYYTPSRRPIHEHGIEPDIEEVLSDEEIRQIIQAQQTIPGVEEAPEIVDRQLQRAIETCQNYEVFMKQREQRMRETQDGGVPVDTDPGPKQDEETEEP